MGVTLLCRRFIFSSKIICSRFWDQERGTRRLEISLTTDENEGRGASGVVDGRSQLPPHVDTW